MNRWLTVLPAVVLTLASWPVHGQAPVETQKGFATGLAAFIDALTGTYGDEGTRVRSGIDAMTVGLDRWDASIGAIERAAIERAEVERGVERGAVSGASSGQASAISGTHLQLGALYLERDRIDDALREFAEVSRQDPRRADVHLLRGLAYDRAGRFEEAAGAFRLARERDANDPVKAYLLVQHTPIVAESTEAQLAVETLLSSAQRQTTTMDGRRRAPFIQIALLEGQPNAEPVFAPASYAEGFALVRRGAYEPAIAQFRKAAAGDPLLVDPALRSEPAIAGIAALRRGQIGAALVQLTAAVERSPDSSEARRVLGRAYWFDQAYGRSAGQFEAAIRLNPLDERSRLALADVLIASGRVADAEQVLRQAIQAIPGSGRAHWMLGRLYRSLTRDVEALHELEQAVALGPMVGVDRLYEEIGKLHLGRNDIDAAIEADRQWTRASPNAAAAHRTLGHAYRLQDRLAEASAEFAVALLLDPQDADAHTAIGQIHAAAGRYRDAVAALRRSTALKPALPEAWYALAAALLRIDEADEGAQALKTFQRLQREAMDDERRTYEVNELKRDAVLHEGRGEYVDAAAFWRQVVDRQPRDIDGLLHLARALVKARQTQSAIDIYTTALALDAPIGVRRELIEAYAALGRVEESRKEQATYDRLKEERLLNLEDGR